MLKRFRLKAFTLAEVLITLGVIGIVAAMTIPTIVQNANDASNKAAWRKAFSVISQAQSKLIHEEVLPVSSLTPYAYSDALASKLKVERRCTVSSSQCWHASNQMFTLANIPVVFTGNATDMVYQLLDGQYLYFSSTAITPVSPLTPADDAGNAGFMLVDINGFKRPNRMGYDIFGIEYYGNAVIATGAVNSYHKKTSGFSYCDRSNNSTSWNNGISCSADALMGVDY